MSKINLIAILYFMTSFFVMSQEIELYIHIPNEENIPRISETSEINGNIILESSNPKLRKVFDKYTIYEFKQAFPTAVTPYLQKVYKLKGDDPQIYIDLKNEFTSIFPVIEKLEKPQLLYEPNDYGTNGGWTANDQTNLDLIQMPQAWDLIRDRQNVVVGITDNYFDVQHEDIKDNILQVRGANNNPHWHGTSVASVLSMTTDNNVGYAGVAFNAPLVLSSNWLDDNEVLLMAQSVIRIMNISWFNRCSFSNIQDSLYQEIRNIHNCIVVSGAGNGTGHCGSLTARIYPASYDAVVSVTSVGHINNRGTGTTNWKDCHEEVIGNPNTAHHHNTAVNISAPGYAVPAVYTNVGSTYGKVWGTSFASPTVAGVFSLMLNANRCLTANEAVDIMLNSTDDIYNIPENANYIGLLGTGRVNAYQAVLGAIEEGTNYINDRYLAGGGLVFDGLYIESNRSEVCPGCSIIFEAEEYTVIGEDFEVPLGAEFEIRTGTYNCN